MQTKLMMPLALGAILACTAFPLASAAPMAVTGHARLAASQATDEEDPDSDQSYPSQSSVASKGPFQTAPASAAEGAIDATDVAGLRELTGKTAAVQGTVTDLYVPHGNAMVILNFSPHYWNAISAVVRHQHYALFPDLQTLRGKHILMRGTVIDYQGHLEIKLTDPDQIKLLP